MPPKCLKCEAYYSFNKDCKCPKLKNMEVVVNTNLTVHVQAVDYAEAVKKANEVTLQTDVDNIDVDIEAETWEVQKVLVGDEEIHE